MTILQIKKMVYRCTAFLLCLVIIVSTFVSSIISTLAKVSDYTLLYDTDGLDTSAKVELGTPEFLFTIGNNAPYSFNASSKFYDYDLDKGSNTSVADNPWIEIKDNYSGSDKTLDAVKERHQDGSRYADIILPIKYAIEVKDILVKQHPKANLMIQDYAVYASSSRATLFDSSNLVNRYVNDNAKQIQVYHYDSEELTNIKYVALRVYDPVRNWDAVITEHGVDQVYLRLFEFNVYGTKINEPEKDYTILHDTTNVDTTAKVHFNTPETLFNISGQSPRAFAFNVTNIYDYDLETYANSSLKETPWLELKDGYAGTEKTNEAIKNSYRDGSRYADIILPIQSAINVNDILVKQHKKAPTMMHDFAVYASSSRDTLFDSSSLIERIQGSTQQLQIFHFKENALTDIKYIALRIYDPVSDWNSVITEHGVDQIYLRLYEFNVYGTYVDPTFTPSALKVNTNFDKVNTNANLDKFVSAYFFKNGAENKVSSSVTSLIDGSSTVGCEFKNIYFYDVAEGYSITDTTYEALGKKYTDKTRYLTVILKAKSNVNIEDITLALHKTSAFRASSFEIFASESLDNLYQASNSIYKTTSNTNQLLHLEFTDGNELKGVRYIALRIYDPLSDWSKSALENSIKEHTVGILYPRIMEFNFYGNYTDPNFKPRTLTDTKDVDLSTIPSLYGENIIAGSTPAVFKNGKRDSNNKIISQLDSIVNTPPSSDKKHVDINVTWVEEGDYIDIRYKANTNYELNQINGFAYQGIWSNKDVYYARKFQVFVSEEPEDLFQGEPVFTFDADQDGLLRGVIYEFPKGEEPKGNYFGIRILEPFDSTDNTLADRNVRLSLLYVWGEQAEVISSPTNLAENMPITAYFTHNGQNAPVSDKNLTVKEVQNLTDSKDNTSATISTDSKERNTLNLLYNLCGDMKIDSLSLSTLINSNTGFKKVNVYASTSLNNVNTKSALIWTCTPKDTGNIFFKKAFKNGLNARYIRFEFLNTNDNVTINTIDVCGLDNQKNKTRNLTSSLEANDITVTAYNTKKKSETPLAYDDIILNYLIDGDNDSYLVFHEGIVGENEYSITLNLGDLRTVSNIQVNFTKFHEIHHPKKVKIYSAESETQLHSTDKNSCAKLIAEFDAKDLKDSQVEKQLKPLLSRYIKVVLSDFKNNDSYRLPDGKYLMNGICSEIKVTGTKVRGMQTSENDEKLVTFSDKNSKIEVSLKRIDINDVFTDVAYMKITKKNATNWQMRSLEKVPYLKIVDKKLYNIKFYDIYDQEVTDIGGRQLEISIKRNSSTANKFMFGYASDKKNIDVMETTIKGGTISASGYNWNVNQDNNIALLELVSQDDPYWESIGELEDFDDSSNTDIHEAEWYETIRTTDGLFEVLGLGEEIETGTKFTSSEISAIASDNDYALILNTVGDKNVAAIFDMDFTLNGLSYEYLDTLEITYNLPSVIYENYSDLAVVRIDEYDDSVTMLWYENIGNSLTFQTDNLGKFAIIGTAVEGYNNLAAFGDQPQTGENVYAIAITVLIMTAAAYTIWITSSKKENK